MTTPRIGAPDWAAAQASPWLTENERARYFDAFATRVTVQDRSLTAPPGSCADGDCYWVAGSPTGAWAGKDGNIAIALGANAASGWLFVDDVLINREGNQIWIADENICAMYIDGAWKEGGLAFVDYTGMADGYYLRYNLSTGTFYGSAT